MKNYLLEHVFVVKRNELKKFLILFLIGNLSIFNFIMLRLLKDTFIISNLGAASIPVVKLFYVLPASIFFMFLYTKLANYFDGRSLFIIFVSIFGIAFLLYTLFFINFKDSITYYIFYTLAESWGTVTLGTAMWAYFNDICTISQAKRFYVLVSGVQIGSIVASIVAESFVSIFGSKFYSTAALYSIIGACFLIIILTIIFKDILKKEIEIEEKVNEPLEERRSIFRGIQLVFTSKYLFLIFFITLCYNFTMIVVEFIWKSNLGLAYPNEEKLIIFNSRYSFWTTIISAVVSVFFSAGFINYLGITTALILFPMVFGISTSFYFFNFVTPIGGAVQWVVSKTAKYAFSDPAKQVLFIPCNTEEKYKAKSVIDIFGARGGKAIASLFNMIFLSHIGDFYKRANVSYPIIMFIILLWIMASLVVGMTFNKLEKLEKQK